MKLPREFYNRDAHEVAKELMGKVLVRNTVEGVVKGRIVEVEVYKGTADSMDYACHAFPMKRTGRTEVMFGEAGHAYIYLIYGMYSCLNIVCNEENIPECVLIRALEPVEGIEIMKQRRKQEKLYSLCSGPGKICQALALTREQNGLDLCGEEFFVEDDYIISESVCDKTTPGNMHAVHGRTFEIQASKRINIDYAGEAVDFMWRYTIADHPFLSVKEKKSKKVQEDKE